MKGVGEQPALEVDAVFGGALSILELFEGDLGTFDENFILGNRGVEGADEFHEVGLPFDSIDEEIRVIGGTRADLVNERGFRLELSRKGDERVVFHEASDPMIDLGGWAILAVICQAEVLDRVSETKAGNL